MRGMISGMDRSIVVPESTPIPASEPGRQTPVRDDVRSTTPRHPRWKSLLVAFGGYLVLSVIVWWDVWSTHPTSTTTCGCGDSSLFLWFLEWPAYAITHGHNPLYSTAMFHPTGIDLLANTSELAIGIVLAPVTWLFGPVATLNVALTLTPALSALAMFWLLRRWVTWTPAAFAGGLLYGFSPFVFSVLGDAHLMEGVLVIPPLIVACLDEMLIRQQRRRPVVVGIVLGLLVTVQFFIGTEMLAITMIAAAAGVVLLVLYAAVHDMADLRRRLRYAVTSVISAGAVAVALLAYPAWFAFAGPAHLSGRVWSTLPAGYGGVTLSYFWQPSLSTQYLVKLQHQIGGYQGPAVPQLEYMGIGLLAVLVLGLVIWRRDRRLWFFAVLAVLCVALSLGRENSYWVPWRVLAKLPAVDNIIPARFTAVTDLCAAVLLGIIVDLVYRAVAEARTGRGGPDHEAGQDGPVQPNSAQSNPSQLIPARSNQAQPISLHGRARKYLAPLIATAVALVALVPVAVELSGNVPLTVVPVELPQWFTEVAPHLPDGQVVLAYPLPFTLQQSVLSWQAVDGMRFSIAGGSGPEGSLSRAGKERPGMTLLTASSMALGIPANLTAADLQRVHQALAEWGVTMVVIPDQRGLPSYEQVFRSPYAVGLITAATGQRPVYQAHAWVWSQVNTSSGPASISSQAFQTCVGTSSQVSGPPETVPDCVLAAAVPQT